MKYYLTLNINKRIQFKSCMIFACGIKFEDLSFLFSFKERVEILYNKLKLEKIL